MVLIKAVLTQPYDRGDGKIWQTGLSLSGILNEHTFTTISIWQTLPDENGKFQWFRKKIDIPRDKIEVMSSCEDKSPHRILMETVFIILFGLMQNDLEMSRIKIDPKSISRFKDTDLVDKLVSISREQGSFLPAELQQLLNRYVELNQDIPLTPPVIDFFGAYMRSCILAVHQIPGNYELPLELSQELVTTLADSFQDFVDIRPSFEKGNGVFARCKVDANCPVVIYPVHGIGTHTDDKITCPDHVSVHAYDDSDGRYNFYVPGIGEYSTKNGSVSFIIGDPKKTTDGLMHFCNCNGEESNIRAMYLPGVNVGITIGELEAGTELTLRYGPEYWQALRKVPTYIVN